MNHEIFILLTIIGIGIAIFGTIYASFHNRKFKSERMIIAYVGIGISIVGFIGTTSLRIGF